MANTPDESCPAADAIARFHLEQVEIRLQKLHALSRELRRMIEECSHGYANQCGLIEVLKDHPHCGCEHCSPVPLDISRTLPWHSFASWPSWRGRHHRSWWFSWLPRAGGTGLCPVIRSPGGASRSSAAPASGRPDRCDTSRIPRSCAGTRRTPASARR